MTATTTSSVKLPKSPAPPEDQSFLRAAFDATKDAILVVDAFGKAVHHNLPFEEVFGVKSSDISASSPGTLQEQLARCFATKSVFEEKWQQLLAGEKTEWDIVKPQNRVLEASLSKVEHDDGAIRVVVWHDVTERRLLDTSLQQANKMEVLGKLTGGITHDFNNLLAAIGGNIGLALANLDHGKREEVASLLSDAMKAAMGGRALVKQLLDHSRRRSTKIETQDLRAIVTDVRNILKHSISPLIKVEMHWPENLWNILADEHHVQQIVLNLCVNAADALKDRPDPRITILAANYSRHASDAAMSKQGGAEFIRLQVKDNGPGIPPHVRQRLFERFFTTKKEGEGTGLGLSICRDIAEKMGGWIECDSEPGRETTFSVFLPRGTGACKNAPVAPQATAKAVKGTERLLIVDDDALVRSVSVRLLKGAGYQVNIAVDGQEAVDWVKAHPGEVDLVLMDVTMPRLSGGDATRIIREMMPDMPVVLCSGLPLDVSRFKEAYGTLPNATLLKPFDLAELSVVVRQTLDKAAKKNVPLAPVPVMPE